MMPYKHIPHPCGLEKGLDLEMNIVGSLDQDICTGENGNIEESHPIIPAYNDGRKGGDFHIHQTLVRENKEPIQNPCKLTGNIHTNLKTCA